MNDDFDGMWSEREELLNIENQKEVCLCDDFGVEECPVHSTRDIELEMMTNEEVEMLTKKRNKKDDEI
jgi:hypothetical protein